MPVTILVLTTSTIMPTQSGPLLVQNTSNFEKEESSPEIEFEDADKALRPMSLTKALEEKNTSLGPTLLASFDILSPIFELCSMTDWTSPLRIGAVSRYWRSTVLNTPRAWQFVDTTYVSDFIRDIYFERSRGHGLHANSHKFENGNAVDKVRCLTIVGSPGNTGIPIFPRLERFCYSNTMRQLADVTILSASHFPLLRHLELHNMIDATPELFDMPPLESLIISAHDEDGWMQIMHACKLSLTSLTITIYQCYSQLTVHIELPKLLYLKIVDRVPDSRRICLDLTTPILTTYIEDSPTRRTSPVRCITPEVVTNMRLSHQPSLLGSKGLRVLQLDIDFYQFRNLLEELKAGSHAYPSLEKLEFHRPNALHTYLGDVMETTLMHWDWSNFPRLKQSPRLTKTWSEKLPGETGHLV